MSITGTNRRTPLVRRLLILFVAVSVLLAACSGDSDESSFTGDFDAGTDDSGDSADDSAPSATVRATEDPDDTADADMADADDSAFDEEDLASAVVGEPSGGGDFSVPAVISGLAVGRQIISTGEVVIESADVTKATADVIEVVFANGGAIWGQNTRTEPDAQTVLTIRVPPGDFNRVMEAIADLRGAQFVSQSVTTDDVTEVVVDLDARITAAASSVDRVQVLLDAARDLNTVFNLEEELAQRQAQLERLRGQRKTIGDQITLATITLTIIELDPDRLTSEMEVVAWLGVDVDDACPGVSDLSIGEDGSAVLCVNISNTGEDTLTDIEISSSTFRLRSGDFNVNQGSTGSLESLAAGEELLVYADLESDGGFIRRVDASNGIRINVDVVATPETASTFELNGADSVFISADVDDPLPGFTDSFANGWGAMIAVLSVVMIGIGVLLPFLPFLLLAAWLGRIAVRRSRARADARADYVEAYVASVPPSSPTPPPPAS